MVIRVRKEDSAYLYQILESYEGLVSYSTLTSAPGHPYRDIVLHPASGPIAGLQRLLERLREEIALEVLS